MTKYYAVKEGRSPGIYTSWSTCKEEVLGYKGAIYKKFNSLEEAQAFIEGKKEEDLFSYDLIAYVDGSFNSKEKIFSWGLVILEGDRPKEYKGYRKGGDARHRNVAGELYASRAAINYCLDHNYKSIIIYYDYAGIENWALGTWKRNYPLTQSYYEFCQKAMEKIDIAFKKVKAHSGVKYNELADSLAKKAIEEAIEGGKNVERL